MKTKSVSGCVLGILGGVVLGFTAYGALALTAIILALLAVAEGSFQGNFIGICSIISLVGAVVSVIGGFVCLGHAKAGGIILLIASALCLIMPISLIVFSFTLEVSVELYLLIGIWILLILMPLIGGIKAIKKKTAQNNNIVEITPTNNN